MALDVEAHGSVGAAASAASPHRDVDPTTCYERRRYLLARARAEGRVGVTGAAEDLHMSVETVRRDLKVLEAHGLVRREYGVAYPVESAGFESDLASRESEWLPEKRRIAAEAVLQIDDAETIFIDEGYLPQLVARQLPTGDRTHCRHSVTARRFDACSAPVVLGGRPRRTGAGTDVGDRRPLGDVDAVRLRDRPGLHGCERHLTKLTA